MSETGETDTFCIAQASFSGPFDLLLTLISKHELDITEVSLSLVTDEFIAYLSRFSGQHESELNRASEFLVVAATLLDLKLASLLPQGEPVDAEEVALLEARDLLFARLLQYRAFKESSGWFRQRIETEQQRHPREVPLDQRYRERAPQITQQLTAAEFAAVAALVFAPRDTPQVSLQHLHAPLVSIREQAAILVSLLRKAKARSFRELITGVIDRAVIVARFLALLELYQHGTVHFDQLEPLGELRVQWVATGFSDKQLATLGADYV